jgi:hypothetical protein
MVLKVGVPQDLYFAYPVLTTISVLEGLWEYEKVYGELTAIHDARAKAHEFLWLHHLYRSHRTGEIFDKKISMHLFPPRWRYDVLRALDYFLDCNAPRDHRMADGIETLRKKRKTDQRWRLNADMTGLKYFEMEETGKPSRMNTLRALRVLNWWSQAEESSEGKEILGENTCSGT